MIEMIIDTTIPTSPVISFGKELGSLDEILGLSEKIAESKRKFKIKKCLRIEAERKQAKANEIQAEVTAMQEHLARLEERMNACDDKAEAIYDENMNQARMLRKLLSSVDRKTTLGKLEAKAIEAKIAMFEHRAKVMKEDALMEGDMIVAEGTLLEEELYLKEQELEVFQKPLTFREKHNAVKRMDAEDAKKAQERAELDAADTPEKLERVVQKLDVAWHDVEAKIRKIMAVTFDYDGMQEAMLRGKCAKILVAKNLDEGNPSFSVDVRENILYFKMVKDFDNRKRAA